MSAPAQKFDDRPGFYATISPESRPYGLALSTATVCYADLPPGQYQGWVDGATAGATLRLAYITTASPLPTIAAGDMPAVTAATSAQASPYPNTGKAITGGAEVPADSSRLQLHVSPGHRLALLLSTGTGTLRLTQVL